MKEVLFFNGLRLVEWPVANPVQEVGGWRGVMQSSWVSCLVVYANFPDIYPDTALISSSPVQLTRS